MLLLRLSPLFPFNLLNYALGLTAVRFADYLVASIGMLPGTLLYVYYGKVAGDVARLAGGTAVRRGPAYYVVLGLGLLATAAVTAILARTARRALREATDGGDQPADPVAGVPPHGARVEPFDHFNRELVANVHPDGWVDPEPRARYHLVVVGAGTGGLVSAAIAAGLGARVALVERHLMGGDCLNVGCVPSKALIGTARSWQAAADSGGRFGGPAVAGSGDFEEAMARMRRLRAGLSRMDGARAEATHPGHRPLEWPEPAMRTVPPESAAACHDRAVPIRAFDGTQPTLRQSPP